MPTHQRHPPLRQWGMLIVMILKESDCTGLAIFVNAPGNRAGHTLYSKIAGLIMFEDLFLIFLFPLFFFFFLTPKGVNTSLKRTKLISYCSQNSIASFSSYMKRIALDDNSFPVCSTNLFGFLYFFSFRTTDQNFVLLF